VEPFVRRYLLDDEVISLEAAAKMIEERLSNAHRGLGIWAIEAEGKRVGCVALTEVSGLALAAFPGLAGEVEPVIALHEPAAGRGLAGEALDALLAYVEGPPLRRTLVAAMADEPNERSHRLLLRHDFAPIGTAPGPRFPLIAYERRRSPA
jgi:RimJ/RimL family protein N-acetyltransferase